MKFAYQKEIWYGRNMHHQDLAVFEASSIEEAKKFLEEERKNARGSEVRVGDKLYKVTLEEVN